jgi:hypothetical protein
LTAPHGEPPFVLRALDSADHRRSRLFVLQ